MTSTTMASDLAREALEPGTRWSHLKRGHTYEVVGVGRMQAHWFSFPVHAKGAVHVDMEEVVIYRDRADGPIWVRPVSEFLDGRFEPLPRTAYDAIGSGVKALPRSDGEGGWTLTEEVRRDLQKVAEGWQDVSLEAVETIALEVERRVLSCLSTHTAAGAGPVGLPADPETGMHDLTLGNILRATREEAMRGSPPAGAGPVGEAVAWQRRLSGPKVKDEGWHMVTQGVAAFALEHGHPEGLPDVTCEVRPLYARPAEEPGEAERLTRERDEAREELSAFKACHGIGRVEDGYREVIWREATEFFQDECNIVSRSDHEAALAETRERLEKVEAAVHEAIEHLGDHDARATSRAIAMGLARNALRAALTGDAQEAGK